MPIVRPLTTPYPCSFGIACDDANANEFRTCTMRYMWVMNARDTTDGSLPERTGSGDPTVAIKENLTDTQIEKSTDDELARPKDDRSPLT